MALFHRTRSTFLSWHPGIIAAPRIGLHTQGLDGARSAAVVNNKHILVGIRALDQLLVQDAASCSPLRLARSWASTVQ